MKKLILFSILTNDNHQSMSSLETLNFTSAVIRHGNNTHKDNEYFRMDL